MSDARTELDRIIREKGEDYASLSRLIGRNAAYVQQFVKRGSPRRLAEEDRQVLARYLGVDESLLGAPAAPPATTPGGIVAVPRLDVGASAGPGALAGEEAATGAIGFDAVWLRRLGAAAGQVSLIRVQGDSMAPTLSDGDDIMVDRADAASRLRDGIYVLRVDDQLIVKRLAINPGDRSLQIRSDNSDFPGWTACDPASISIIGRVAWLGRKLR